MNNEEKFIKIHRDDLYKKAWKTLMSRLASEYGISDVALATIFNSSVGQSTINLQLKAL